MESDLTVALEKVSEGDAYPSDFSLKVTLQNKGPDTVQIIQDLFRVPSRMLEILNPSGDRVEFTPPPHPESPVSVRELSGGEEYSFVYERFLPPDLPRGEYMATWIGTTFLRNGGQIRPTASDPVAFTLRTDPQSKAHDGLAAIPGFGEEGGIPAGRPPPSWVPNPAQKEKEVFSTQICIGMTQSQVWPEGCGEVLKGFVLDRKVPEHHKWRGCFRIDLFTSPPRIDVAVPIWITNPDKDPKKTQNVKKVAEEAVEQTWSKGFCMVAKDDRGQRTEFPICVRLEWVGTDGTRPRHYHKVTIPTMRYDPPDWKSTLTTWFPQDGFRIAHEVGHLLGNKDEYGTVDGKPYGCWGQDGGGIMNNLRELPHPKNFNMVKEAVSEKVRAASLHIEAPRGTNP